MIRTRHLAALAAALTVTACGAAPSEPDTEPSTFAETSAAPTEAATSASPTPEPTPDLPIDDSPLEAADGGDVDACFDGECEVAVAESTVIPFDPATGIEAYSIAEVGDDYILLGTHLGQVRLTPSTCNAVNDVGFTLRSVSGDTAIVAFYPAVECP